MHYFYLLAWHSFFSTSLILGFVISSKGNFTNLLSSNVLHCSITFLRSTAVHLRFCRWAVYSSSIQKNLVVIFSSVSRLCDFTIRSFCLLSGMHILTRYYIIVSLLEKQAPVIKKIFQTLQKRVQVPLWVFPLLYYSSNNIFYNHYITALANFRHHGLVNLMAET